MALVCGLGGWTALFWAGAGIAACLVGILTGAHARRRLARAAELLAATPLPVLPPLPGLDMPSRQDPLEAIEGIGPEVADLLRADGIRTFDDLAQRGSAGMRARVRELAPGPAGPPDPASWAVQARLLAHGQFEAFANLARTLEDGRVPLESICEPTQAWRPRRDAAARRARALRAAGVHGVEDLVARSDAEALARALCETGGVDVTAAEVASWIERAILFERGNETAYLGLVDPRIVARMGAVAAPYPLTSDYQALLDRRTVAFSQAVVTEFDAATRRWRDAAAALLGRRSARVATGSDARAGRRGR